MGYLIKWTKKLAIVQAFFVVLSSALAALHLRNPLLEHYIGSISISTAHELSSRDDKFLAEPGFEPGTVGEKRER